MFNRMFRLGLAVIASGTLCPAGMALAQVPDDPNAPTPPSAAPAAKPPRSTSGLPGSAKRRLLDKPQKIEDGDVWKKHPPIWSIHDPAPFTHPYATDIHVAPGVGAYPGGPAGQFGSPYYYMNNMQYSGGGYYAGGPTVAGGAAFGQAGGGLSFGGPPIVNGAPIGGGLGGGPGGYPIGPNPMGPPVGMGVGGGGFGPGGYGIGMGGGIGPGGMGVGPQMAAYPGTLPGNPYFYHFGPGFYRFQEAGHYRFPYYSYRRPWYFPGHPSYNRDTNIPW